MVRCGDGGGGLGIGGDMGVKGLWRRGDGEVWGWWWCMV